MKLHISDLIVIGSISNYLALGVPVTHLLQNAFVSVLNLRLSLDPRVLHDIVAL